MNQTQRSSIPLINHEASNLAPEVHRPIGLVDSDTGNDASIDATSTATQWIKAILHDQAHDGFVNCPYDLEKLLKLFQDRKYTTREQRMEMLLRPLVEDEKASRILDRALGSLCVCQDIALFKLEIC